MYDFERGDIVHIRDFAFGRPTRIKGKVVGVLHGEYYNIFLTNGMNEGTIISYKGYQLIDERDVHIDLEEN
jgi:hypothetical protein